MIKELRIGNLFELPNNHISSVTGLTEKGKVWFVRNPRDEECAFEVNDIKPIPLTEEWKEKIKDNEELLIDASGFVIFKNGYAYQFVFEDYPFVHKIQNLFQILTNKELEFKKQPE